MAIIDTERDVIVVRIIYDGPPLSGKTTTIHSLGKVLGKKTHIFSPQDAELSRTLYFDWMEYVGGFFKGRSISCQIITVPEQAKLRAQRHFLLNAADAVVFVLDANETDFTTTLDCFHDLQAVINNSENDHPADILVQANKQDFDNILPVNALRTKLNIDDDIKVIETIATEEKGIREAFVTAVGMAVKRAEALMTAGKIETGKPDFADGETLLNLLQTTVGDIPEALNDDIENNAITTTEVMTESTSPQLRLPTFPDESTPLQWIYPPLTGRTLLKSFLQHSLRPHLKSGETWWVEADQNWRGFSKKTWLYDSEEQARTVMREHTAWHLQCSPMLSEQRCISLTQDENQWRLWQLVQLDVTLATCLEQAFQETEMPKLILEVYRTATRYIDAYQQYIDFSPKMNLTLDNIGVTNTAQLVYLGCLDKPNDSYTHVLLSSDEISKLVYDTFAQPIQEAVQHYNINQETALEELKAAPAFEDHIAVLDTLIEVFDQA